MYLVIDNNPMQKPVDPSIECKGLVATCPRSWGVGIFKAEAFDSGVVNRAILFLKRNEKRSGSERGFSEKRLGVFSSPSPELAPRRTAGFSLRTLVALLALSARLLDVKSTLGCCVERPGVGTRLMGGSKGKGYGAMVFHTFKVFLGVRKAHSAQHRKTVLLRQKQEDSMLLRSEIQSSLGGGSPKEQRSIYAFLGPGVAVGSACLSCLPRARELCFAPKIHDPKGWRDQRTLVSPFPVKDASQTDNTVTWELGFHHSSLGVDIRDKQGTLKRGVVGKSLCQVKYSKSTRTARQSNLQVRSKTRSGMDYELELPAVRKW
ncbi:hypothetical protein B0H14DRAFT_2568033 [Mycena olivaceomarginata]|nr:hypothetical protein B0H14DRAFT_2568033 [Mycena olivaceomarginata]